MRLEEAFERLNISLDLIPVGSSNRPGTRLQPTHITIHNTANAAQGADALMHARYVKSADARARQVSWHFTMDDKRCVKHLPTNEVGWHAGRGNSKSIAIEICEHQGIDQNQANERASLLAAVLMFQLNIPLEHIVTHQSWTGKHCPHVLLGQQGGFEAFRRKVADFHQQLQSTHRDIQMAAAAPTPGNAGMALLADQADAGTAEGLDQALAPTTTDRVVELEQLVGRLTVENEALRRALRELQSNVFEAD